MYQASVEKLTLNFKRAAGTSRGVLKTKNSWIISIWDSENPLFVGKGEASIIENLSPEWSSDYEYRLSELLNDINDYTDNLELLSDYPSIRFAIESALINLKEGKEDSYYPSLFTENKAGIKINGLIWMGEKSFMLDQVRTKLDQGFSCVKLKIGAIDFDAELDLLKYIRSQFSKDDVELRVDANGAFKPEEALEKLNQLSKFDLHSIEQPIMAGQLAEMHELCRTSPLPIALDEELIGINGIKAKSDLIEAIKPQYIILKPSLVGGFTSADEWISIAEEKAIAWWITSALESNIGLNAIAQFTYKKDNPMPQGLGTGLLFSNNIESPLYIEGDQLNFKV
jgi:o-succinylbenzoate synthase